MKIKNILVTLVIFASTLIVTIDYIYLQHKARNQFIELQKLTEQEHNLNTDWGRLQIEYSTLVNNSQIEAKAKQQLNMELPQKNRILSIKR